MSVINNSRYYYSNNIVDLLKDISTVSELQYLSLVVDGASASAISELPLLVDTESYNNIIDYYGGKTLAIPTKDDIYNNILGIMSYYYYNIKGESWNNVLKKLGVPKTMGNRKLLTNRYNKVAEKLNGDIKIPNIEGSNKKSDIVEHHPKNELIRLKSTIVKKSIYDESVLTFLDDMKDNGVIDSDQYDKYVRYLNE